jgi:hypothetical protein
VLDICTIPVAQIIEMRRLHLVRDCSLVLGTEDKQRLEKSRELSAGTPGKKYDRTHQKEPDREIIPDRLHNITSSEED